MPAIKFLFGSSPQLLRAVPHPNDQLPSVDAITGEPRLAHWQGFLGLGDPKPRPGRLVSILARYSTNGDGLPCSRSEWIALRDDQRVLGWAVQLRPKVYGVYGIHDAEGWPVVIGGMNPDPWFRPKGRVLKFGRGA